MSEDRVAYRENRVGLNSELHSKKTFNKKINLKAMDISCGKKNINQTYGKNLHYDMVKDWSSAQRGCKICLLRDVQGLTRPWPAQSNFS